MLDEECNKAEAEFWVLRPPCQSELSIKLLQRYLAHLQKLLFC